MKVAWLTPYPTFYFADRLKLHKRVISQPVTWNVNLSKALVKLGDIELHIITQAKELVCDQTLTENNITFHFLKAPQIPRALFAFQFDKWRLRNILAQIQPDLVHSHGTEDAYSYVAVTSNFPCLISMQGIITEIVKTKNISFDKASIHLFISQFFERYAIRRGKYFISKTPFAENFIKNFSKHAIIFNIGDPINEVFFNVERSDEDSFTLLFVGTLLKTKGVEELIEAFSILNKDFPSLKMKLIGHGSENYIQNVLKKQIALLNLTDSIEFCGFKTSVEIAHELSQVSVFVLPSYMETHPNVVAEAMAVGAPIVTTNVGGIPFMIENGKTGLLVEPQNPKMLADSIRCLWEDKNLAKKLGENARKEACKRFQPHLIARQVYDVYKIVLRDV